MSKLKEFLKWHLDNPHNLNFKMIVSYEEREETMKEMQGVVNILDTGLTPDEINALRDINSFVERKFDGALTLKRIVDAFCEFYDANSDGERIAKARLLTNGCVDKWEELRERDTAKEPEEIRDAFGDGRLICPNCRNSVINYFNRSRPPRFCMICGQRLQWEE